MNGPLEWQNFSDALLFSRNQDVPWQRAGLRHLLPCQKKKAEEISVTLSFLA